MINRITNNFQRNFSDILQEKNLESGDLLEESKDGKI